MSDQTIYDEHASMYVAFVDAALAAEPSLFRLILGALLDEVGPLPGTRILDVACGEGYVARAVRAAGADEVVGIDISEALVTEARHRSADVDGLTFAVDDARTLATQPDASFDAAVSQMAMMDIADHRAAFRAIARIVRPGGSFVFSLLHPCFESPFRAPEEQPFLDDADGEHVAVMVRHYAAEGQWTADAGVRGHVGSHHRMLSTYVNDLLAAGFRLTAIREILGGSGLTAEVPRTMVIAARRD